MNRSKGQEKFNSYYNRAGFSEGGARKAHTRTILEEAGIDAVAKNNNVSREEAKPIWFAMTLPERTATITAFNSGR